MFKVGDYIVYGNRGVCRIEAVGYIEMAGIPNDRVYYTLCPEYAKNDKIFTPVDNKKIMMRSVITKKEATQLINDIQDIEILRVPNERRREAEYKEVFKKCDCRELVKMIKTIYLREQSRLAEGKRATVEDEKYLYMAEEGLYGEMAIALGVDKEQVKKVFENTILD